MKKKVNNLNLLYNAFVSQNYPIEIVHFVTEHCNAKCPHCFINFEKIKKELSLDEIEKIAKTTGKNLKTVALTGGEPFLRDDLFDIAKIWYENSTIDSIVIPTNASMPDKIDSFLKKANKFNLPLFFFLSYDFIDKEHSKYRVIEDLHLKILESYKIIKSYGDKFSATFQITLSNNNYLTAIDTYKYIRDVLKIKNINCSLCRGEQINNLSFDIKNKISQVYKEIQTQINNDYDNNILNEYKNNDITKIVLNSKNKILWKYVLKTFVENKYISKCKAGKLLGIIYSDGTVSPCELISTNDNLREYDYNFLKYWNSHSVKKIREQILKTKCHCTYECSWLINIFSNPKYCFDIFKVILNNFKSK